MAQSILIVDDERDIVSMLNQYFCKIGYVVYTAINGKEALNAITKHPDIILLDINMPDMNGFTICEKVWGLDGSGDNSVITEHIRRIRTKFLSIGDNPYIETVWGCGYKWKK